MLRLASDVDVNGAIVRGLRRRFSTIDLVRVQDVLPENTPDVDILAWTTAENRILITRDRNTMVRHALDRASQGQPIPGLIVTTDGQTIGAAVEHLATIAECMSAEEIASQVVVFLPLR